MRRATIQAMIALSAKVVHAAKSVAIARIPIVTVKAVRIEGKNDEKTTDGRCGGSCGLHDT